MARWRYSSSSPALLASIVAVATGCFTSNDGLSPPHDSFYFPTAIVVSPGRGALFIANSDFDLEYNGGTVQTIDLGALRPQLKSMRDALAKQDLASACAGLGVNNNDILSPGPCGPIAAAPLIKSFATIGAFASNALLVPRPDQSGLRLFLPVRGDPSITFFDVDDDRSGGAQSFRLDCGATGADLRCAPFHKIGQNPYENLRRLVLPVEPVGIAVADDATSIVVAHQTAAAVSLVVNDWTPPNRPTLEYFYPGLPPGPTEIATIPTPALFNAITTPVAYQPGFLVTYNAAAEVDLFRFQNDSASTPPRPFITLAGAFTTNINGSGADSRGIAIDGSARAACESACSSTDADCLRACCTTKPLALYVANRAPASLLIGRIDTFVTGPLASPTGAFDTVTFFDTIALEVGPSKVAVGNIIDRNGALSPRVFAVSFDSRFIFSYDPEEHRVDNIIRTGRGPHAIAFDTGDDGDGLHSYLYVDHFTDSYVGVVDLDERNTVTFGNMFASLGAPLPPRETQ